MVLSNDERKKLELISSLKLDRNGTELILGRKLSNAEWKSISRDYKKIFTPIAKQAAKLASKKYSVKKEDNLKLKYKDIAIQAAKVAKRKLNKTIKDEPDDKYHFIKSMFKEENTSDREYTIRRTFEYFSQRYRTTLTHWKIFGHVDLFNIHKAISEIVNKMTENLEPNVRIQISLTSPSGTEPHTELLSKEDATNLATEWVNYFIDYYDMNIEDITFKLTAIELPQGAGRPNAITNLDDKRSITQIKNKDKLCLVRAILVGLSYNENFLGTIFKNKLTMEEINEINEKRRQVNRTEINNGIFTKNEIKYLKQGGEKKLQTVLAEAFHRIYYIPERDKGNDFSDIKLIENKINIEVQVYSMDTRQIYAGVSKDVKVCLILSNNHYDVISKLPAFLGTNARTWEANEKRKCEVCKNETKCEMRDKVKCQTCGKECYNQQCFERHIVNRRCIEHSYVCQKCFKGFETKLRKPEDHKCGEWMCPNCKDWFIKGHKCFMQKKKLREISEKYIFYDFETTCNNEGKHVVNYCIAQYFDGTQRIFNSADEFCTWVFRKEHNDYTVIAHYGKGYDFQFVQEWLINHAVKPEVIYNGQKILQLEVKRNYNIRFIDSISFTMQPLRDFPKTFGLVELAKGYFPHEFNKIENQAYVGNYPDKKYYGYEQMTKNNKEDFNIWYETVKDQEFDFQKEMHKYCKSDVDILRRGCLTLRQLFLDISGIDPFQYVTIASVCTAIYRNEFLPENTIGIVNELGGDQYSIKSIKWLKYISLRENINIKHACNGGEYWITINGDRKLKVDGFCKETNTIYQFQGCYFHGCPKCFNDLTKNKKSGEYMYKTYEKTISIENAIRKAGYKLCTIWEHDFDNDKEMKNVSLTEYDLVEPPKIRDSFFGGRCEPIKLLHDCKSNMQKKKDIYT